MKTILLVTAALLAAVSLSSCGDDSSAPDGRDAPAALSLDELDGRAFTSVRVDGHRLVKDTRIQLGFDGADVSANAGCNHLFGTAAVDGDVLVVSSMGGTEMGCPDGLNDQDAWLTEFLGAGPTAVLAGDTLTLTGGDVVIELAEQQTSSPAPTGDPDQPTADSSEGVVSDE